MEAVGVGRAAGRRVRRRDDRLFGGQRGNDLRRCLLCDLRRERRPVNRAEPELVGEFFLASWTLFHLFKTLPANHTGKSSLFRKKLQIFSPSFKPGSASPGRPYNLLKCAPSGIREDERPAQMHFSGLVLMRGPAVRLPP